jgi:uncharacterized damage-inducible protein DinB
MNSVFLVELNLLIQQWKGHRNLTRKVIEAFPEQALFEYKVEGMRSFADMVKEIISLDAPGIRSILADKPTPYNHDLPYHTKSALLAAWDESSQAIDELLVQLAPSRFFEDFNLFGEYNFPIIENIMYFIDNEIHHRAQGYVYLRLLGIEPPFFWDREDAKD